MERMEHPSLNCSTCGLVPLVQTLKGATQVIAHSDAMGSLLKRVQRFSQSDAPVVIGGETGTGKEIVARVLHANGLRAHAPFTAVNVGALPAELLEAELFGSARGAYTGSVAMRRGLMEVSDGGTLFLDEIGEMPLALQVKLLRVLQDGEVRRVGETRAFGVDVRVICATHRDLTRLVQEGRFREDLYYRLKVLSITVPPLRERPDDILPLALRFLADEKGGAREFSAEARACIQSHAWPGNVRELQNAVKHGAALAVGPRVELDDLPEDLQAGAPARALEALEADAPGAPPVTGGRVDAPILLENLPSLAEVERQHIERVLAACGGAQTAAARVLGIARNTLWRKLQQWD